MAQRRTRSPGGISRRGFLTGAAASTLLSGLRPRIGRASSTPPNILYVYPDQLRRQALSSQGEVNISTPVMDSLLASGTSFERCYTTNPRCSPARSSMLTGLYPSKTGVLGNSYALSTQWPSLAQMLGGAGYRCGYVGKWHLDGDENGWTDPSRRFGFDDYWAAYNIKHKYMSSSYWTDSPTELFPDPLDTFEPEYQTDQALDFMDTYRNEPWFLMLGYAPPHPPGKTPIWDWTPHIPQQYLDMVDANDLVLRPNVPAWIEGPNEGPPGSGGNPDPGARHYLQGYYSSILAMEDNIANLLDGLDSLGLAYDTIVVFTSDHGDLGGSHGDYGKGSPADEATGVPLAFRWPSVIPAGAVWPFPVSLADILPTILGLTGVQTNTLLHGSDLTPWLVYETPPEEGELEEPVTAFVQGILNNPSKTFYSVAARKWKYTRYNNLAVELYSLTNDPYELDNLIDVLGYGPFAGLMRLQLRAWKKLVR